MTVFLIDDSEVALSYRRSFTSKRRSETESRMKQHAVIVLLNSLCSFSEDNYNLTHR